MNTTPTHIQSSDEKLVSAREAASRYGMSVSWLYEEVAAGRIPKPIKLGKSSRWRLSALLQNIDERSAATAANA